jgi:CDP-diacylglycerol--glycerol-3-phosphate 3-phosphatidyltransferase
MSLLRPNTPSNNNNNNNNNVDNNNFPCITLIGSPNFGVRSITRDVESQLVILTENSNLQQHLNEEMKHIFCTAERVTDQTFKQPQLKGNFWVSLLIPFAKTFM